MDRDMRKRLLDRLEREGGYQNVEYELRRRNGRIITVLENAHVVRDEAGKVLYYEGTLTDITHRKRIEEQLRQAQKVEALGRLAAGIAHDFSNVLTVIAGYGELALSELAAGHPARGSVEQVMQSVESAVALTRQLISFSRRQARARGGLDLNRAIEHGEGALQRLLPGIRLDISYARELAPVYADRDQIDQIALSLAGSLRDIAPAMRTLSLRIELIHLDAELCRRFPGSRAGPCALLSIFNPELETRALAEWLSDPLLCPRSRRTRRRWDSRPSTLCCRRAKDSWPSAARPAGPPDFMFSCPAPCPRPLARPPNRLNTRPPVFPAKRFFWSRMNRW